MSGVELKQQLKLSQTLILTPQLQLAIKLLQLPRLELIEVIRQELETNPVLDDVQGTQEDEDIETTPLESLEESKQESIENNISETEVKRCKEIDWERYLENASLSPVIPVYRKAPDEELPGIESAPSKEENLFEYLMWQVRLSNFTPQEEKLAAMIIGNLDEYGYFRETKIENAPLYSNKETETIQPFAYEGRDSAIEESAETGKEEQISEEISERETDWISLEHLAKELNMTLEQAETVLKKIQFLDPPGIAARSLEECLLVQAEVYALGDTVKEIIKNHLKDIQKRNFSAIARNLKISIEEVMDAVRKITNLEPKPARNFTGEVPKAIVPDVYIEKVEEGYVAKIKEYDRSGSYVKEEYEKVIDGYIVRINDDGMPKLRISESYRKHISDPNVKDYIKDKLRSAQWLIRSIEQREKTIVRVTECIVRKQKEFMEKGSAFLKPMVLSDVAKELGLHESTISRVTSGKYVHTPQGIFELKYFFNRGIEKTGSEETSSEAVKNRIKEIIAGENPDSPLSDRQIVSILAKEGIMIARRTVAKYRDMLGILSSSMRKRKMP